MLMLMPQLMMSHCHFSTTVSKPNLPGINGFPESPSNSADCTANTTHRSIKMYIYIHWEWHFLQSDRELNSLHFLNISEPFPRVASAAYLSSVPRGRGLRAAQGLEADHISSNVRIAKSCSESDFGEKLAPYDKGETWGWNVICLSEPAFIDYTANNAKPTDKMS